jgi:hypothetical protein
VSIRNLPEHKQVTKHNKAHSAGSDKNVINLVLDVQLQHSLSAMHHNSIREVMVLVNARVGIRAISIVLLEADNMPHCDGEGGSLD